MHFKNFYGVKLFQSSMAMTSVCQKAICIHQDCRNKGFMFIIKDVWDQVSSLENQFLTSAVENGCLLPLRKVSLGSDEALMSYYLFIFSFHQHVQYMTSQNLLIFIDFDSFFGHLLISNC